MGRNPLCDFLVYGDLTHKFILGTKELIYIRLCPLIQPLEVITLYQQSISETFQDLAPQGNCTFSVSPGLDVVKV